MRLLRIAEYERRAYAALPPDAVKGLVDSKAVTAATDANGRTRVKAGKWVGVVRSGDVVLRVLPKMPIHRLLWLLGYARNTSGWHEDEIVGLDDVGDLVAAVAISFLAAVRRAIAPGLLQGYRTVDAVSPVLRGRLREADQLRLRAGIVVPLEVRFDDYTVDIAENRILLAATMRMLRMPGVPTPTRVGLQRLLSDLVDVMPSAHGEALPAAPPNRLTLRYQPALRLAQLILAGRGIDQAEGSVSASGFLFDINAAFEDWLLGLLRESLASYGGHVRGQSVRSLDDAGLLHIRPDVLWERDGRPIAVLDAKYKVSEARGDIYQMVTYCTALGLASGHLVYASGSKQREYVIRTCGIRIRVWTLDLAKPIDEVRAQILRIADTVRESLP